MRSDHPPIIMALGLALSLSSAGLQADSSPRQVRTWQVRLANGDPLPWDRLIVAPGIDFLYDRLPGLASTEAQARVPHGQHLLQLRLRP